MPFDFATQAEFVSRGHIVPQNVDESRLLNRTIHYNGPKVASKNMPIGAGSSSFTQAHYETLKDWVLKYGVRAPVESVDVSEFTCEDDSKTSPSKSLILSKVQYQNALTDLFGAAVLTAVSGPFYANELGAWTTAHSTFNMPTITFGRGGGKLESGYFIDCRQRPLKLQKGYYSGRPYKQFLQAVMSSMGVPKSEYMQFGDGQGFGEFNPIVDQFGWRVDMFSRYAASHNDPLPFFYKG